MALPTWQNPLDWLTQCWNIALGKRVRPVEDNWLIGPIGAVAEQADAFIDRLSSENRLSIRRNEPGAGLIDSMAEWGIPINSSVSDFYTKTSDYDFEVSNSWRPVFGSLGYLVAKLFSRRIQQLNLPRVAAGELVVLRSEIIKLLDGDGRTACTIWHRSIRNTGEVVFYGIYSLCRIPSGELCVKAVFPLPRGSARMRSTISCRTRNSGGCFPLAGMCG